ncbi:LuxR C-terminal-related transcriptional regulator [Desulfohalovibrio reitneri]|uniref:LuxR C-terminal-related transcriptional regulator n=1 Tax=Desulfohalovibrio reitneri TaxID=1307759 RepID=UPI00110ECC79|nr:LuxR C-terminal-related transcriptional regulator [Desulfohalovibrio reitneri]
MTKETIALPTNDPGACLDLLEDLGLPAILSDARGKLLRVTPRAKSFYPKTRGKDVHVPDLLNLNAQDRPERFIQARSAKDGTAMAVRCIPLDVGEETGHLWLLQREDDFDPLLSPLRTKLERKQFALNEAEKLFDTLFHLTRNPLLLISEEGKVVSANQPACELFQTALSDLLGSGLDELLSIRSAHGLNQILRRLGDEETWIGEQEAVDTAGGSFPVETTVCRANLAEKSLFYLIFRDLSRERLLSEDLEEEKRRSDDLSSTLRNLSRSFEDEKSELQKEFLHSAEVTLSPILEKMADTDDRDVRLELKESAMSMVRDLAKDPSSSGLDDALLKLTPTEIEVCQYILTKKSTKEIADLLNSSLETIQTHRKNIRKKLDLKGKSTTLYSFLRSKRNAIFG